MKFASSHSFIPEDQQLFDRILASHGNLESEAAKPGGYTNFNLSNKRNERKPVKKSLWNLPVVGDSPRLWGIKNSVSRPGGADRILRSDAGVQKNESHITAVLKS